ncbi:S8 family serine peptidase [candidate division WOR-3 bacterium]|nr:S8 family serine peptidase [candidate division WOR-3 bacterium]
MKRLCIILCVSVFVVVSLCTCAHATESSKKKITNIDELPRHTYKVTGTISELIANENEFALLAIQVRADIEKDLETYEIEDKTTLKDYYRILVRLDMLSEDYDASLVGIDRMRELEDKPAEKLMIGVISKSIIRARCDIGIENETAYEQAFSKILSQAIEELPWEVVQERIRETKGQMEFYSENFLLGIVQSQLEPVVKQTGQMSSEIAARVIGIRYLMEISLPLKEQIVDILDKYIKANHIEKKNIWEERNVDLSEIQNLHPVVIAIWDSGVDTNLFPDQLFINTNEKLNGKDDDANGFVDDVHGIAYTFEEKKTSELLYPIEHGEERRARMKDMVKGFFDLQAGIDSPEATALKQKLSTMSPEQVKPFMEDIMQFALYSHGTHTASIAVDGNPVARILVARFTIDYHLIPPAPTVEKAHRTAQTYRETVKYFKTHGVRVVNMSWGGTLRGTESDLEANGIGKDAEDRAKLARELFDIEKEALYAAMQSAPNILFVNAAGNDNDDVSFEDYYPAAFDLTNLLVVGAVDQAGDETSFTSFGERVNVYANGYEVEGLLPGGDKLAASGTSTSSPNVANLAAKLFALEPSLTVDEVVSLIKEGAEQNKDGRLFLINPNRSVELLRSMKRK